MTQAYNLAIMANAVDSSGKLNVATNSTGVLPVANGGTGTSTPSLVAGTGITITGSFPNQTVASSGGAGTVTSVATGNGLSGGTITTTGTLVIAAPGSNTVGSYIYAQFNVPCPCVLANVTFGSNYSAGGGQSQIQATILSGGSTTTTNVSGTWKWMGASWANRSSPAYAIAVRVS